MNIIGYLFSYRYLQVGWVFQLGIMPYNYATKSIQKIYFSPLLTVNLPIFILLSILSVLLLYETFLQDYFLCHSIKSDNGSMSQKILLESKSFCKQNVDIGVAYTCLQMACAPSKDSDQPGHSPSLIRVFAVRLKKARILSYP